MCKKVNVNVCPQTRIPWRWVKTRARTEWMTTPSARLALRGKHKANQVLRGASFTVLMATGKIMRHEGNISSSRIYNVLKVFWGGKYYSELRTIEVRSGGHSPDHSLINKPNRITHSVCKCGRETQLPPEPSVQVTALENYHLIFIHWPSLPDQNRQSNMNWRSWYMVINCCPVAWKTWQQRVWPKLDLSGLNITK